MFSSFEVSGVWFELDAFSQVGPRKCLMLAVPKKPRPPLFESKVPVVVSTCFKLSTRLPECVVQSFGVESWISVRVWAAASFSAVSSSQAHVLLPSVCFAGRCRFASYAQCWPMVR